MSDFVSNDILPDLWEEILQRHWTFLETEESIQKLEERKKLEGCLKEFLCVVPHDRKFFLPETAHVLRKSIREMDEFTAYKAIVGFESISQYANNLFTKPWRKEFRVLKTYSGFYHHEVKLNLLDADKMFEAMGYRRVSDEILVLDGPICPDQVTNVSRDAMAAYVECQIIKHIFSGLLAMGISCSWQDVYHYREKHVGGTTQAIKSIAYTIQERRARKDKQYNTNEPCYASVQQVPQVPQVPQCNNCVPYHQVSQNQYMMPHMQQPMHSHCALHGNSNVMYNGSGNNLGSKLIASYPAPNTYNLPTCAQQHPQMTHSRSLEHYNEPHAILPHRHSFDHQHQGCTPHHYQQLQPMPQHLYESPYDCIDGGSLGSSASYSLVGETATNQNPAYAHPYNVSGNRVPLPFNISNQLNTHYATPNVTCNGVKGTTDGYVNVPENASNYATIAKKSNCNIHGQMPMPAHNLPQPRQHFNAKDMLAVKQRPLPPDQLIDFDDRAALLGHDYNAQQLNTASALEYERDCAYDRRIDVGPAVCPTNVPIYAQPILSADRHMPITSTSQNMLSTGGSYDYARPMPRNSRPINSNAGIIKPGSMTDKRVRSKEISQDLMDNNLQMQTELNTAINNLTLHPSTSRRKLVTAAQSSERDTSDHTSYDSTNLDELASAYHGSKPVTRSPTQAVKNQDGVGSYESWNYVFQNLERSGYTKDLGEREDLLMQSLDLGANGAPGSNTATVVPNDADKRRDLSQTMVVKKPIDKLPATTTNPTAASTGATKKIVKSALKTTRQATGNSIPNNDNKPVNNNFDANNKSNNNNNGMTNNSSSNNTTRPHTNGERNGAAQKQPPPVSTQVIVTGPNEWSCQYCTFLNPNSKRVCEMCCRSKDFQLDAVIISHAPTCV